MEKVVATATVGTAASEAGREERRKGTSTESPCTEKSFSFCRRRCENEQTIIRWGSQRERTGVRMRELGCYLLFLFLCFALAYEGIKQKLPSPPPLIDTCSMYPPQTTCAFFFVLVSQSLTMFFRGIGMICQRKNVANVVWMTIIVQILCLFLLLFN